jgi:hypothetical protein
MATFSPFVDAEHDELDLMAPANPNSFFASAPGLKSPRPVLRSLRPRESLGRVERTRTRQKRTLSMAGIENDTEINAIKKSRMGEKKAVRFVSDLPCNFSTNYSFITPGNSCHERQEVHTRRGEETMVVSPSSSLGASASTFKHVFPQSPIRDGCVQGQDSLRTPS